MESILGWFAASAIVAVLIAIFARQRGWGMALPVLAAGAIVGALPMGPSSVPDPEVFLIAILAPLVFGEALGSSFLDIRRVRRPVLALAVGLVIATTLVVGGVAFQIAAMPLAVAFALGAVLAPTDAVAVSTVARKAALPRGLVSILEGESLVNDGTGLTALSVAILAAVAGSITALQIGVAFVLAIVVGVGIGLLGGWVLAFVLARSNDTIAANSLVLVAPFGLYLVADRLEGSGILAVVIAGLYAAHSQSTKARNPGRLQSAMLWRHVTFVLQALAFFMVGIELVNTLLAVSSQERSLVAILIVSVVLALIVTRVVFVMGLVGVLGRRMPTFHGQPTSRLIRGAFIVGWSGARGPISALAAFSIPLVIASGDPFPFRNVVVATTFGVIVVTLLLAQTIGPIARKLKVQEVDGQASTRRLDAALAYAALKELDEVEEAVDLRGQHIEREVIEALRSETQRRIDAIAQDADAVEPDQLAPTSVDLRRLMIRAEQEELLRIRDEEGLPDSLVRPAQLALDLRQQALGPRKPGS